MCWMYDHPAATFDDYLQEVVRPTVARCGHAVQATDWRGRPMAYTVGLTERGEPELVVTGKPPDEAHDLLGALLAGEEQPSLDARCDLVQGPALWALPVDKPERLSVAWRLYPELTALQVVWADAFGRWPWEVDRSPQRLLSLPAERGRLAG
ncbi:MAG: hypothetical protein JWO22_2681 [Frankiales bacterium]|nr:hypothetical protein [Frankiales bacterium]